MVRRRGIRLLFILFTAAMMLVAAGCTPKYAISISVSPEGAGTVSPASGTSYEEGTEVTLTAEPASTYRFDHWSGDATGTSSPVTIIMDIDKSVTAHFVLQYLLNASVSPEGAGTVSPASDTYHDEGTKITLKASPASGYYFDHWSGDATGTSNPAHLGMYSDKSVTAHFKPLHTMSTSVSPEGAGTVSPDSGKYQDGFQATLNAKPASGYLFDHWSGDATGTSSVAIVTMDSDKDVIAYFKIFFSPIFSEVSQGTGVSQAAAYQGDEHPVVLLGSDGDEHYWSDEIPIEWLPGAVEEAQLVVCVGEEKENAIQTCYYNGPNITRYQYSIDITLREAKTGKVVARTTLRGDPPRQCMQTEDYWLTRLEGSSVSFEQVEEWLQKYVAS